jgi:WS/DGAT/MGAT family acyltransferase
MAGEVVNDLRDPRHALREAAQLAAGTAAAVHLFALPPDARTSLHGPVGDVKQVVWSHPIPLTALRDSAHAATVTVNDLVLTAVTGALRAYLARTDGRSPDVRAVIPVNLRNPDVPLPAELGNDFGLAYLRLPVSIDDPQERMAELCRRTRAFKRSPEAAVAFGTLRLIGHLPYEAEQLFVEAFSAKASAVITNVAGPARPVYLAGRRVRGTIAWPPESGKLALGMSIVSYDGQVVLGLLADANVVSDPRRLLAEAVAELDQLRQLCAAR